MREDLIHKVFYDAQETKLQKYFHLHNKNNLANQFQLVTHRNKPFCKSHLSDKQLTKRSSDVISQIGSL